MLDTMLMDAVISQTKCTKFLSGDGITTPEFEINKFPTVFEGLSINSRVARKVSPAFGDVFSIAKNLDEYQYKICTNVPSLPDSPSKVMLQKYRIAIAAAFAKLVFVVREDQDSLLSWIGHARSLLEEASEFNVSATTNDSRMQKSKISEALSFFGLSEDKVDKLLASAYGQ